MNSGIRLGACAAMVGLAACSSPPEGCDYFVSPGGDDHAAIQEALVSARAGETVCLDEGVFRVSDSLAVRDLANFTLRGEGMDETILDFANQTTGGSGVDMQNMTNVLVHDFAIRDPAGNGIRVQNSDGVIIRRLWAGWTTAVDRTNGKYSIYPVTSRNVLVEDSISVASSDAGFYMGQNENCVLRNNEAYGNVAALEIENSTNCEVYGNDAHENSGALLVFELPGLPMRGRGTLVHDNILRDNNVENFGDPAAIVGLLPSGTGMMVLAANDVEVRDNTITGNESIGIVVLSYDTVLALQGQASSGDPAYDGFSEDIHIHGNTFDNNGASPGGVTLDGDLDGLAKLLALMGDARTTEELEDIGWDGFSAPGATNDLCIRGNGDATFRNFNVPDLGEPGYVSPTDPAPYNCELPSRPAVMPPSFAEAD